MRMDIRFLHGEPHAAFHGAVPRRGGLYRGGLLGDVRVNLAP
jgi:hypothetical protein